MNFFLISVIVVHNSELLAGALDKSIIGSGSKSSIFYILLRDFGEQVGPKRAYCRVIRFSDPIQFRYFYYYYFK